MISSNTASAKTKDRYYFEARNEAVWEVPTGQRVVALTFDDGPNTRYTPLVLDLLKKYHDRATFFVIGSRAEKYPYLINRELREGHEVGNHTFSHRSARMMSSAALEKDIMKAQRILATYSGRSPYLFRPVGGYYNESVIETAKRAGCKVVMWSWDQDTRDWRKPGVQSIVKQVVTHLHNGDIILMHDHGGDRKQTLAALKIILPILQEKGYRSVTVSELLWLGQSRTWNR